MCGLTHTAPKSSRRETRMARPWSRVQTLAARPYRTSLAQRTAWSSSVNRRTGMAGPEHSPVPIAAPPPRRGGGGRGEEAPPPPDPVAAGHDLGVPRRPVQEALDPGELV